MPRLPPDRRRAGNVSNADQTVDYVVNAWDMDDPGLTTGNKGKQKDTPSKLSRIPRPAERIYLADNEAGPWRPVILNRKTSTSHPHSTSWTCGPRRTWPPQGRRPSATTSPGGSPRDRHRTRGCNNLFFDGHSDWLSAEDNTSRYWCGVEMP